MQETAKDTLKKLVDEKLETVKRMSDIERSLSNTEDEYSTLKELYDREVEENRKLAEEISRLLRDQASIINNLFCFDLPSKTIFKVDTF